MLGPENTTDEDVGRVAWHLPDDGPGGGAQLDVAVTDFAACGL